MILRAKYKFKGIDRVVFCANGELWQSGYVTNNRYYPPRIIPEKIHKNQISYRIHGKWYSKKRLNKLAYLIDEQFDTMQLPESEQPF